MSSVRSKKPVEKQWVDVGQGSPVSREDLRVPQSLPYIRIDFPAWDRSCPCTELGSNARRFGDGPMMLPVGLDSSPFLLGSHSDVHDYTYDYIKAVIAEWSK